MFKKPRKLIYLIIIGGLTSSAIGAAYWQTNRYFESKQKWKMIASQLNKENPDNFAALTRGSTYPLKYVSLQGKLLPDFILVSRARQGLVGSLVVRPLQYTDKTQKGQSKRYILAMVGWIPDQYEYEAKTKTKLFKGIIRPQQKTDYLHKKMKETDIQKFNINTYIDINKSAMKLGISPQDINQQYYIQILKDLNEESENQNYYPYQYRVDNFQLPYLTPQKHQGYATFWTLTSFVGLAAMIKVIKMK